MNRRFQFAFCAFAAGASLLVLAAVYYYAVYRHFRWLEAVPPEKLAALLPYQERSITTFCIVLALAAAVLTGLAGIIVSHRIAGPLYRIVQSLDGFSRGEPIRTITLRKGDHFEEVADACNRFLTSEAGARPAAARKERAGS